jgi:hypothetical protein
MEWSITDIIKTDELTGCEIHGCILLNKIDKYKYYGKINNMVVVVDTKSNRLAAVNLKVLRQYKNPYIRLHCGVTVIFTDECREIYIDTRDYDKIKDKIIGVSSTLNEDGSERLLAIDRSTGLSIRKIIYGKYVSSLNKNILDMRRANGCLYENKTFEKDVIDNDIVDMRTDIEYKAGDIRELDVVKKYGLEGNIIGDIQVLNKINDKDYFVRVQCVDKVYIAIESEDDLRYRKRFKLKELRRLRNNPYLELRDGSIVMFNLRGYEIILDKDIFYKEIENRHVNTMYSGGNVGPRVVVDSGNGVRIDLGNFILDTEYEKDKAIVHINGNKLDFRIRNLKIVKRSDYIKIRRRFRGIMKRESMDGSVKYRVSITLNKKVVHIGVFDNYEDALEARIKAEKEYWMVN